MHDEAVTDIDDAILQLTGLCCGYNVHVIFIFIFFEKCSQAEGITWPIKSHNVWLFVKVCIGPINY